MPGASALFGDYGITDRAFLDVVTGLARPEGRLPIELPSSEAEVEVLAPDLPSDTRHPLFSKGFGPPYAAPLRPSNPVISAMRTN